jgi:hypothetical protein
MGLLDDRPYMRYHPDAKSLVERLTILLGRKTAAKTLILASGVIEGDVDWEGPMADIWPVVLEIAAKKGKLRVLVMQALEDYSIGSLANRPARSRVPT